ncbi:hypothetical protein QRD02_05495 [Aequorivita sp. SDUM287046]|uniref:Threonine synthase n=1 Tax=Aequorivita aurantiaca TaxID=3053356 RepID=A0ABT8DET2_9FLAO|nr:DUF6503 family protein [Aequorivita aurantiaca]MDN3723827.1 hypothetical protein [Aequorivita aurantiaca]
MKKLIMAISFLIALSACKNDKKENPENLNVAPSVKVEEADSSEISNINITKDEEKTKEFPAPLQSVFATHGGLAHWKAMNNLCFEMKGRNGRETHTISLPDRKTKIESKDWSIGYDGKGVWLLKHELGYQGDPKFYHNLIFYFYAMPFIISDPGTNYEALGPTELDGKMYNGYKVSYNQGVGTSPDDEYKLYFDPNTNKMAWLSYTVTFSDQKKNEDWHYIKYDKWQEVNGLLLPEKLVWYNVEKGKPKGKEMDIKFEKVTTTETMLDGSVFKKPAEAEYVQ